MKFHCDRADGFIFIIKYMEEKAMKKGRVLLAALFVTMAAALGGCAGGKTAETPEDHITIGIPQDLDDGLDPHKVSAAGTKEILFNVYEGLLKYDENGALNPAIAESYDVDEDRMGYTFHLRSGVKFHDGSSVTADDVVYSLKRLSGADGSDPLEEALINIADIQKKDENTVYVKLLKEDPDFLCYMTDAIMPASNADPETNVIGTGPYKFVSHTPQESVELEAFDEYWGEKAHIKNVTLKIISNADSIVMELKGGTIDMFCRLSDTQVAELEGSDFNIEEGAMNLVQALYLNNDFGPFEDERVRQAICYAIDPEEIMAYVSGGKGSEIGSAMFPAFGKYYDPALNDTYNKDTEKAKALLNEAGYGDGFSFSITVPSNYTPHVATAEVIVEELKEIGVTAEIKLVEWDTWLSETYMGRNYEATVIGVDASPLTARALLDRYASDANNNFVNFKDPDYDTALAAALSETDDAVQTEYYKECLRLLSEHAASAYIQDLPSFVALNKKFSGYKFYPLYAQDFASLYYTGE